MDSQERVRVGVVGCGYQGRLIAQAVSMTDGLQVVACADPDKAAAAAVTSLDYDVASYESVDHLLDRTEVDAVIIATPHHLLYETALTAIGKRKHVLAEKPIAMNEHQAARIDAAVEQAGISYMAGYSLRFFVAQRQVFELLEAGAIGDTRVISAGMGTGPLSGWFAKPEMGGGALLYLGSHVVDQILWLAQDEPVEVFAQVTYRSDNGTDETSAFQIRFSSGTIAQCLVTQAIEGWFDFVYIYGTKGKIDLSCSNWLRYDISVTSSNLPSYAEPTIIRPRLRGDPIMMMLVPELEEFASAIQEGRQPTVTANDGRRVLKVLDAVTESAKIGRPVSIN
jgi:phthalate 4,5-cis-dihydrodiol dehydrogenase